MTAVIIDDDSLKYLQKKLCCRNCHHTIIKKLDELATVDEVIMMRDQLRILNKTKTLPNSLEEDIRDIIRRKQNETHANIDG